MPLTSKIDGAYTIIYWKDNAGSAEIRRVEHVGKAEASEYTGKSVSVDKASVEPTTPNMTDTLQTLWNNCDSKYKTENSIT